MILDAVVYGFHAARPALIDSGGGSVLATASLAGLAAIGLQPVYGANKAAVVALARALVVQAGVDPYYIRFPNLPRARWPEPVS